MVLLTVEDLHDICEDARAKADNGKFSLAKALYGTILDQTELYENLGKLDVKERREWWKISKMCQEELELIYEFEAVLKEIPPAVDPPFRSPPPSSARGVKPDEKKGHVALRARPPPLSAPSVKPDEKKGHVTPRERPPPLSVPGGTPQAKSPPFIPKTSNKKTFEPPRRTTPLNLDDFRPPPEDDYLSSLDSLGLTKVKKEMDNEHSERSGTRIQQLKLTPRQPKLTPRLAKSTTPRAVAGGPKSSPPPSARGAPERSTRKYEKPWKKPPPSQDKRRQSGTSDESAFFQYMCPHGDSSPNAELVRQVELNMLEKVPVVTFDSVAGLDGAIKLLKEAVIYPQRIPNFFVGIRSPWKGVLLYGPPGTGKTTLAKAVANCKDTTFMNVSVGSLASKFRGDSERMIRIIFQCARFHAPCTIFIDEIDAIGGERGADSEHEASRRTKSELLTQMDGLHENDSEDEDPEKNKLNVTILAATNRPWDLDGALRRRLEKRIYIPLPDDASRKKAFELNMSKMNCDEDVDYDKLMKKSKGYSCADITSVCRDAAMMPLRHAVSQGLEEDDVVERLTLGNQNISMQDFLNALENVPKSVGTKNLDEFETWTTEYGTKLFGK